MGKLKVAVLMGGTSTERAISLSTGRQIIAALDPDKYIPMALDAAILTGSAPPSLPPEAERVELPGAQQSTEMVALGLGDIAASESSGRPDVVFIALHGKGGEDGTIQGVLELLGIPYTGSGVLASALAMDKAMTKRLLRADGIPVPGEIVVRRADLAEVSEMDSKIQSAFGYPVIVKPNTQGSTIGCHIVRVSSDLARALYDAFKYDSTVLIEEFIEGIEITAGLLGDEDPQALPLIEITTKSGFYDYESKYAAGGSAHIIPARISPIAAERATTYARAAHNGLGCRGMSRVDFIVRDDQPYLLEVNTIPGMTPTSLLPDAARATGIGFGELLDRIIESAIRNSTAGGKV